jgi:hypothetical protein
MSDKNVAFLTAKNNMSKSQGKHKQKGENSSQSPICKQSSGFIKTFCKNIKIKKM